MYVTYSNGEVHDVAGNVIATLDDVKFVMAETDKNQEQFRKELTERIDRILKKLGVDPETVT